MIIKPTKPNPWTGFPKIEHIGTRLETLVLTKFIFHQLELASLDDITNGNVLGYVNYRGRNAIIGLDTNYKFFPLNKTSKSSMIAYTEEYLLTLKELNEIVASEAYKILSDKAFECQILIPM